ncbi:GNAT family N-acetyltransferase [Streptomyces sp. NPDC048172]|uniref:GNAT family N-acetyltransferase n=1 Tax=Streptomyces sp. NPDC048172 TaxID=3365505 RepID=UPI00371BC8BB
MQSAHIRAARPADLPAVAAIYAHYVARTVVTFDEEPLDAAAWRRKYDDLAARGLPFLVAAGPGDEIAGYAYAAPWRPKPAYRHTVEDTVYLAPGRTGQGLGGALLAALLLRSAGAGVRQMIAVISDVDEEVGPASIALHARHGFKETGRLTAVGRKHGQWIDTVLMQRSLGVG